MTKTLQVPENFKTITVRWPNKPGIPTSSGKWHRLPDGRIEATYTRQELSIILGILEGILSRPYQNKRS